MPIKFRCTNCGRKGMAPGSLSGKNARCKCGATIRIPKNTDPPLLREMRATDEGKKQIVTSALSPVK